MAAKKGKRRAPRGRGCTRFNARRNVWVHRQPVGRTPRGHTRYVEVSDPTQAGLLVKMKALSPPGPRTTLGEWLARWVESLDLRPRTLDSYRLSVSAYLTPTLGHLPVATLTAHHLEHAARQLEGKYGLKANTVRLTLTHLGIALNAARRVGLCQTNPVQVMRKPRGVPKDIQPFSVAQVERIAAEALRRPSTHPVAVLALMGLRVGECVALEVPDFHSKDGTLAITKTAGVRGVGPPKTRNSVRTIEVHPDLLPMLRGAVKGRARGYLFPTLAGSYKPTNCVRYPWKQLLKRLGFPLKPFPNLHLLRHSWASHALAAGVPVADVARYLGDSVQTVVKHYVHSVGVDVAGVMGKVFTTTRKKQR